jgi:hypothetical protein
MKNAIGKIGAGLGILALYYNSLEAQNPNPLVVKAGPAYNIVQKKIFSKKCFGVETLLEKKLGNKSFAEWELGMYWSTHPNNSIVYSKMQTNIGFEYKPFIKNGWAIGGKLALGVSSEFYKPIEWAVPTQEVSLNKLVGLDVEKNRLSLGISKEIDRNAWRMGIRLKLRPEKSYGNYPNRKYYPMLIF